MIELERYDYGTFFMVDLPWTDERKGIGFGDIENSEALVAFEEN